ncbi:hypothetical protein ACQKNX_02165 [Lysinibacillus sp. NPDC093712]|uniref:hypothetical protein n=1 Tax=Lysinibacillus sp. NPDC093712 TaxID=3390579 RepID=UPI003D08ABFA
MDELLKKIEALEARVKVLEDARSYVGQKLKNFYCNGAFGRVYDLEDAEIIIDSGLRIEVRTTEGYYRWTEFENYEEKHTDLAIWLTGVEDDE